ncbi:uncharacterized protein IL334_004950 [Kwoniella shivajii]|uniref:Uncharacterized protein n=1 Tax=Kwoniella shivajii TaxID=564305 RepID=A0ABZ1D1S6_9TREE|nr:hypothetical protein IL334_004950 [Kwoniella shivajii]
MSVNSVQVDQERRPALQHGENFLTPGHTAEVELKVPATIQGPKRTENAKGNIWVTDKRVLFVADTLDTPGTSASAANVPSNPPDYDAPPSLSSLEIPYISMRSATYNLPTFSANHLLLTFIPSSSSLPDPGTGQYIELKIWIGEGAGHAIWKRIEGERIRAAERQNHSEEEDLPAYAPA